MVFSVLIAVMIVGFATYGYGRYCVRETFGTQELLNEWTRELEAVELGRMNEVYGMQDSTAVQAILKDFG